LVTSAGPINVLASMGMALCLEGETLDQVIARADAAVYKAKASGRNRLIVADMQPHEKQVASAGSA
jgi:PleD family two-component response regulator